MSQQNEGQTPARLTRERYCELLDKAATNNWSSMVLDRLLAHDAEQRRIIEANDTDERKLQARVAALENELCTAKDQIPPSMEGDSLSVALIKLNDLVKALEQERDRWAKAPKLVADSWEDQCKDLQQQLATAQQERERVIRKHDELASILIAAKVKTQAIEREVINPRIKEVENHLQTAREQQERLREALEECQIALFEGIPRYVEMFESAGLGDKTQSVWLMQANKAQQHALEALAPTPGGKEEQ